MLEFWIWASFWNNWLTVQCQLGVVPFSDQIQYVNGKQVDCISEPFGLVISQDVHLEQNRKNDQSKTDNYYFDFLIINWMYLTAVSSINTVLSIIYLLFCCHNYVAPHVNAIAWILNESIG